MTLALRLVWRGSLWGPPVEPTHTIGSLQSDHLKSCRRG